MDGSGFIWSQKEGGESRVVAFLVGGNEFRSEEEEYSRDLYCSPLSLGKHPSWLGNRFLWVTSEMLSSGSLLEPSEGVLLGLQKRKDWRGFPFSASTTKGRVTVWGTGLSTWEQLPCLQHQKFGRDKVVWLWDQSVLAKPTGSCLESHVIFFRLFCKYIRVIDSTYKWCHMVFVFLFLTYFT